MKAMNSRDTRWYIAIILAIACFFLLLRAKDGILTNLAPVDCQRGLFNGDLPSECNTSFLASDMGHSGILDTVYTLALWDSREYEQLAQRCANATICGCFAGSTQGVALTLHDQIDA